MRSIAYLLGLALLIFTANGTCASNCFTILSGDWGQDTIWNCDGIHRLPSGDDGIYIMDNHTVTVSGTQVYVEGEPAYIFLYGTLTFASATDKLHLPKDSGIRVYGEGLLLPFGNNGVTATNNMFCTSLDMSGNVISAGERVLWATPCGGVAGYSDLGDALTLMPIQFIKCGATVANQGILLAWEINDMQPGLGQLVQKSNNGTDWQTLPLPIKEVGKGKFEMLDEDENTGVCYYRIGILTDKKLPIWSIIIKTMSKETKQYFEIYPTMVTQHEIWVECTKTTEAIEYDIVGTNGNPFLRGTLYPNGMNRKQLDISELQPGNYIVHLRLGKAEQFYKFMVL